MSKYNALWAYLQEQPPLPVKLTFAQIEKIAGVPLDHSFLSAKKELAAYGWQVGRISLKEQTVVFEKAVQ